MNPANMSIIQLVLDAGQIAVSIYIHAPILVAYTTCRNSIPQATYTKRTEGYSEACVTDLPYLGMILDWLPKLRKLNGEEGI